jgi:hypothetical protein
MVRSGRSLPKAEPALAPPLVITAGLITLLAVAGYLLMKPTVHKNPGVAAYEPPAATKVLDYGWGPKSAAVERAANEVAEGENRKLGLRSPVIASMQNQHSAVDAFAPTPTQNARTARVQKRQDTSAQSQPRLSQREPASFSAFARGWFGRF